MSLINKKAFIECNICEVRGWISHNQSSPRDSSTEGQFRKAQGIDIGIRARDLFPEGILVSETQPKLAFQKTTRLLKDPHTVTLFEATFCTEDFVARADIVKKGRGGLAVFEVKSSLADTKEITKYVKDLAYTTMVIEQCGYVVKEANLLLISREFRRGRRNIDLFEVVQATTEVMNQKKQWSTQLPHLVSVIKSKSRPTKAISYDCRNCEYLKSCFDLERKYSIFVLPNPRREIIDALLSQNKYFLSNLEDEDLKDNPLWKRIRNAVVNQKRVVSNINLLRRKMQSLQYPIGYLDFETVSTVIPLYNDVAPLEAVPFQYSLHISKKAHGSLDHREFLFSVPSKDETHELALRLVEDTMDCRTLMAHNASTEKRIIKWLAGRVETYSRVLSRRLLGLLSLFVDMKPLVKDHIYDPEFHGSFSIKDVLPALTRNMSYDKMAIANGNDAQYVFANLALGRYEPNEAIHKIHELLEYCSLDTLAMVEIHKTLLEIASEIE